VIAWHRQGFKVFWRRRSSRGKVDRPRILRDHIAFISLTGSQLTDLLKKLPDGITYELILDKEEP